MAISEEKQSFDRGNIGKQERMLPHKEEKKDTSLFRGESHVSQGEGKSWAEGNKAYELTGIPKEKRSEIWKKLTKGTDIHFQRIEAEEIYKDIKDHPEGSKKKYGIESESERRDMLKMLEKSLGK